MCEPLLRARRKRPRRRAAEQSDKIPSPHGSSLSEDRTLPHRQMGSTLCITANLAADWQLWVKSPHYRTATWEFALTSNSGR